VAGGYVLSTISLVLASVIVSAIVITGGISIGVNQFKW
jgi:hypothetical protein